MSKKICVQWGAGNIGRACIAQVFSREGYEIIFIDIKKPLIDALNAQGKYAVESVTRNSSHSYVIHHVSAIEAHQEQDVINAIVEADIMSISVGKNNLPTVCKQLATSLLVRYKKRPEAPLNIIIAENMSNGAHVITSLLKASLPTSFPIKKYVGLVETSIGKMVPFQERDNMLKVISEEYNDLIVDKYGFIGPIPTSKYIIPVTPIKAYVERKLYIHNLGHASCAYIGSYYNQQASYINEVLLDPSLFAKVKKVMDQSMMIVAACYPKIFTKLELQHHVDDLLFRFTNPSLGDTLYRVGKDLKRKLHYSDRIMGAIIQAQSLALSWSEIACVYIYALEFDRKDKNGNYNKEDVEFLSSIEHLPFKEKVRKASSLYNSSLSNEAISTILDGMELIFLTMYANRKHT